MALGCPDLGTFIIFSGLPGVGKTAIAKRLAHELAAVYLRADTIEEALRQSGMIREPMNDAGYRVAYAVAEENLLLGRTVIADSVNPFAITRDAYRSVATRASVRAIEVEVVCSDVAEHRARVENRPNDIAGFDLPAWNQVANREYHAWTREHLVIDSAKMSVDEAVAMIMQRLKH